MCCLALIFKASLAFTKVAAGFTCTITNDTSLSFVEKHGPNDAFAAKEGEGEAQAGFIPLECSWCRQGHPRPCTPTFLSFQIPPCIEDFNGDNRFWMRRR